MTPSSSFAAALVTGPHYFINGRHDPRICQACKGGAVNVSPGDYRNVLASMRAGPVSATIQQHQFINGCHDPQMCNGCITEKPKSSMDVIDLTGDEAPNGGDGLQNNAIYQTSNGSKVIRMKRSSEDAPKLMSGISEKMQKLEVSKDK